MTRILSAVALSMLVAYPASATSFWLSPFGTELGSTQPSPFNIPTLDNFVTQTASVYVWAQTDPGETLENWSLRVVSTNPSILTFTTSTVYNPTLGTPGNVRWEYTVEPTSNSATSGDFMGFTITNDPNNDTGLGIGPSTATVDPDYYGPSDGSGSWLLAKLDYTIGNTLGTTELFLQIGTLGLNNAGLNSEGMKATSADTQVQFGHVGDSVGNAEVSNRLMSSSFLDAAVQVLLEPEPDADFDNDTFVTGRDFLIWQRNFGTVGTGTQPNGDATGDGNIDGDDLAVWESQYGMMIPLGGTLVDGMATTLEDPILDALEAFPLGDMNLDFVVNKRDAPDFVLGLLDPLQYWIDHKFMFPVQVGNFHPGSSFDFDDIEGFEEAVTSFIPEPTSSGLLLLGSGLLGAAGSRRLKRSVRRSD